MAPEGLKVGDTFVEGSYVYKVLEIVPLGYNVERIKKNNPTAQNVQDTPEQKEVKEEAPASETKYTKTEINRLNNAELEKLCKKLDIEPSTGMAMKKALIEKLGL